MFIIEYEKSSTMSQLIINPSFLFDLHEGIIGNAHEYVTTMAQSVSMGGLWGDFIVIFWIAKYLQRSFYIFLKMPKHIIFQCGMDFQFVPSHIAYEFQHFEPIEYVNSAVRFILLKQMIPKL
jgi:hypothetical protein